MRRPCIDREDDPASGKRSLGTRAIQMSAPASSLTGTGSVPAEQIFEKKRLQNLVRLDDPILF
jgi:hypothetical protein